MGQTNSKPTVGMLGLFPQDATRELQLPGINRFVVPRGGEYFFSPSLSALTGELSNVQGVTNGVKNGVNGVNGHTDLKGCVQRSRASECKPTTSILAIQASEQRTSSPLLCFTLRCVKTL